MKKKWPDFAGSFNEALNEAGYHTTKVKKVTIHPKTRKSPDLIIRLRDGKVATVTIDIRIYEMEKIKK